MWARSSVPKDPQFTRHGADPRWRSLHPVSSHYSSIERPLLSPLPLPFPLCTTASSQLDPFVCFVGQPVVPFEKLLRRLSCSRRCPTKIYRISSRTTHRFSRLAPFARPSGGDHRKSSTAKSRPPPRESTSLLFAHIDDRRS